MEEHSPMALSVRCGSCKNVINIPAKLLPRLMEMSRFNCPHCKAAQHIPSQFLMDAMNRVGTGSSVPLRRTLNGAKPRPARSRFGQQLGEEEEEEEGGDLAEEDEIEAGEIFADYTPSKLKVGVPHPDPVVETASLAAVEPPDITYKLHLQDIIDQERLSGLQLEAIVYACQRHQHTLPWGGRSGFFIGDGAGVGKGRTIAGLILENWRCGRRRHLWVSIGSDLRVDARRDLDDVGAGDVSIHALNKLQYGKLDSDKV